MQQHWWHQWWCWEQKEILSKSTNCILWFRLTRKCRFGRCTSRPLFWPQRPRRVSWWPRPPSWIPFYPRFFNAKREFYWGECWAPTHCDLKADFVPSDAQSRNGHPGVHCIVNRSAELHNSGQPTYTKRQMPRCEHKGYASWHFPLIGAFIQHFFLVRKNWQEWWVEMCDMGNFLGLDILQSILSFFVKLNIVLFLLIWKSKCTHWKTISVWKCGKSGILKWNYFDCSLF